LFPAAINHIFFSYRGASGLDSGRTLVESISFYLNRLAYAFSINNILMFILSGVCILGIIVAVVRKIASKDKKITKIYYYELIIIPTICYFIIVSKIAPK